MIIKDYIKKILIDFSKEIAKEKESASLINAIQKLISTEDIKSQREIVQTIIYLTTNTNTSETIKGYATYILAVFYYHGVVVEQDFKKSVELCTLAAEKNIAMAQYDLATYYVRKIGVKQDYKKALEVLALAAKQNLPIAVLYLGTFYEQGWGVTQNLIEATKLYEIAAKLGLVIAECKLGMCYEEGIGITRNLEKALLLYRSAADKGNAKARYCLGRCYKNGTGVTQDPKKAAELIESAANSKDGYPVASYYLASCYYRGHAEYEKNIELAIRFYKLTLEQLEYYPECEFYKKDCLEWLGKLYELDGITRSPFTALLYYQEAVRYGNKNCEWKVEKQNANIKIQKEVLTFLKTHNIEPAQELSSIVLEYAYDSNANLLINKDTKNKSSCLVM